MLTKLRTSIATRLALILLLAGLVSALCTGYVFYSYTYSKEFAQSQKQLRQLVHAVSQTAAIAAYLDDLTLAKEVVDGIAASDLVKAVVLKSTQETLSTRGIMPDESVETLRFNLDSPFVTGEMVGKLLVAPNIDLIQFDAKKKAMNHVTLIAVQTFILITLIIFYLTDSSLQKLNA